MDQGEEVEMATDHHEPIRYIERTHRWYAALGYPAPYRYAQFAEVPFSPLKKPLRDSTVALLTTAAPFSPDKGDQSVKAPYNAAAKFYEVYSADAAAEHDLRVSHVGVDRANISDDANCWFPLPALRRAAAASRIGRLAPRFHGMPTNRSQRHTMAVDIPVALQRCVEDRADVAVLVPNCPICHQTMTLTARAFEASGISTVIMGAAKDIVELCGAPRFLFSDFPLGSAAGRPFDQASQDDTLDLALKVLESAPGPRTTVQNALRWQGRMPNWRSAYLNYNALSAQEIAAHRARNDEIKSVTHRVRDATVREMS